MYPKYNKNYNSISQTLIVSNLICWRTKITKIKQKLIKTIYTLKNNKNNKTPQND